MFRTSALLRLAGALLVSAALAGCATQSPAAPTSAPAATAAAAPSAQPEATAAPAATAEPAATAAPAPTSVPEATSAPADESLLPAPLYLLNDKQQIVRLERDGATMAVISQESAPIVQLAVSPADGTIIYVLQQDKGGALVSTDARGGNRAELASGTISSPLWSRDGQRYAISWLNGPEGSGVYGGKTGEKPGLLLASIPFDAKAQKPGMHYVPQAFSPDGSKLLLATAPDNGPDAPGGDIAVLGAAVLGSDGKVTELVRTGGDPYMCFSALWSSDGSQVLCSSYGAFNGQPALWSQPATGGEPKILLAAGKDNGQADVFSPIAAGDSILAFVGVSTAGGQNISYTLQQIDATGKASKLRDEQFDSTAVIWSAWAPDASGIVIQRAGSDPNQNTFVYLPASDAAAIELKLSGQGTPVWGAPGT